MQMVQIFTSLLLAAFVGYIGAWYTGFIEGNFALLLFLATVVTGAYWLVLGVFIVMVGLMTTIGAPMAWLRLSIIGAAPTELTAATLAAEAAGSGLGKDNFTIGVMAVTWFAMALNGCGWLLVSGLGAPYLEKIREKMGGGNAKWLAMIGGAASLGVFGYLCANDCRRGMGNILAVAAGAISMVILVKFVVSKHPKFSEYSLGVAMLIGMACAVLHDVAGF